MNSWAMLSGPLPVLVGVFAGSRLVAWAIGVRFDDSPLTYYWQFLDLDLLQYDLARSLWYLHAQPPLLNLFAGVVLKGTAHHSSLVFTAVYVGAGLVLTVATHATLVLLGVRPWLAAMLTAILVLGPACLLYENFLFYTYPTAVLLSVATYSLIRCLRDRSVIWGTAFTFAVALVCLSRSLFHPAWLLVTLLVSHRLARRAFTLRSAAVMSSPALVLVGVLLCKNLLLFGIPSASSWFGMNLFSAAAARVPAPVFSSMYAEGSVSELALLAAEAGSPFVSIERYPERFRRAPPTGVPALDALTKSAYHPVTRQRVPNFNHSAIPAVSRQFFADSLQLITHHPGAYARSVFDNVATFSAPSDSFFNPAWSANAQRISGYGSLYNVVFRGSWPRSSWGPDASFASRMAGKSLLLVILLPTALVVGARAAWHRRSADPGFVAGFIFCATTILYVGAVSNTLNLGESQRMFFLVEPLAFVIAGIGLEEILRQVSRPTAARLGDDTSVDAQVPK